MHHFTPWWVVVFFFFPPHLPSKIFWGTPLEGRVCGAQSDLPLFILWGLARMGCWHVALKRWQRVLRVTDHWHADFLQSSALLQAKLHHSVPILYSSHTLFTRQGNVFYLCFSRLKLNYCKIFFKK